MNEAAFPNPHLRDGSGMTIRDVYAGLAMQGLISINDLDLTHDDYARLAYLLADAMLKERAK
jgi:hypothetical protein